MRRRITEAIVGVSTLILLVLGIPLAIAVHQSILDKEVVELQAAAARALTEVQLPIDTDQLATISDEPDAPLPFSVYDADGNLLFGDAPVRADSVTTRALGGNQASTSTGEIIVATPITDHASERVVGAIRLTESLGEANHQSRMAWLVMIIVALAAIALSWLLGNRVARRLSRPITDLAAAAGRIGNDSGTLEPFNASGIEEIDTLANALADSSIRVQESLARERRFSSDVSHQLRTPLTALRLRLETARTHGNSDVIDGIVGDLDRVEETVDHLLAFARDSMPASASVHLDGSARLAADRWSARVAAHGRSLNVSAPEALAARASPASVDQILDVLIDNALRHGQGDIQITERRIAGGAALDVSDEGSHIVNGEAEHIFERGHGDHHGIGLALARSIAEAEGGRLLLTHVRPTTFSLILLNSESNGGP